MFRVGLTGELGSGKSTVARMLAAHGAIVLSSDDMARTMMQPGHPVYQAIVDHFGPEVLLPDGHLNRPELARLAFNPAQPRVEELNALIHPAVLAEQERQVAAIAQSQPDAIVVIESALIFTTRHGGDQPWRKRFDMIVLVAAPDQVKVQRFVERASQGRPLGTSERSVLEQDALERLQAQRIPQTQLSECLVIENIGTEDDLCLRTEKLFRTLQAAAHHVQVRDTGQ